ncbi:uncharacterized protein TRAVEDRAFT_116127 [Trametes versicolor FP-101664 SS1]|uniref:uncharacterized protein n=1 Tax=Trametes versicolor (strain FP-101664) TaxID=717944 RepID=UPI0004623990|nr:uncharacterized protein TRAVEDRAFT_116127 [Trametes versicolor FP-101664 SS1]EIW62305.1 hypothetical protein TRAVEDRAFT_116127 [Trametes versicolor FP-101664 SS1]
MLIYGADRSYVESLESRLEKLEKLFKQRCPGIDLAHELENEPDGEPENSPIASSSVSSSLRSTIVHASSMITPVSGSASSTSLPQPPPKPAEPNADHTNEDESVRIQNEVIKGLSKLSIDPVARNYHGKSSGLVFIRTAKRLAQQPDDARKAPPIVDTQPSPDSAKAEEDAVSPFKDFPPPDLMDYLIALYFTNVNIYTPLLHAPTFLNSLRNGEHLRDGGFGATVLLVCANGARFSTDPRVFAHGTHSPASRGWKWFAQVERARKSYRAPSRLYDLQVCALMTMFLHNSTRILQSWTVTGVGLRRALEVGAHRKHLGAASLTIENELWRRAFWVLVVMDWDISHAFGRPCMVLEEDIDVPLLTECDDEHWTHGESGTAPRQPLGKPSKLSFYNSFIRLARILAYATRTIYAIRKSLTLADDGNQQQRIVAELDSSLNQWADSVPAHLKWDPHREDEVFLRQSANLHAYFYQVQVCVHRAFILPYHESPLSFPSLIICTNAARACIRLLDELCARIGTPVYRNLVRTVVPPSMRTRAVALTRVRGSRVY